MVAKEHRDEAEFSAAQLSLPPFSANSGHRGEESSRWSLQFLVCLKLIVTWRLIRGLLEELCTGPARYPWKPCGWYGSCGSCFFNNPMRGFGR